MGPGFFVGVTTIPDLGSLIAQQAPPSNPATPATRANPEHEWYVALQCIRRTTEDAQEKATDKGPEVVAILDAIRTACSRLLAGVEPKVVAATMASMAAQPIAPPLAQQLQGLAATMSAPISAPIGVGAPGFMPGAQPLGFPSMGPSGGATAGPVPPAPGGDAAPVTPPVVGG